MKLYGLWYVEIMDNPEMYAGKTVVYRAIMCKPPKYGRYFTPGRFAMVCCADDMTFPAAYFLHLNDFFLGLLAGPDSGYVQHRAIPLVGVPMLHGNL